MHVNDYHLQVPRSCYSLLSLQVHACLPLTRELRAFARYTGSGVMNDYCFPAPDFFDAMRLGEGPVPLPEVF